MENNRNDGERPMHRAGEPVRGNRDPLDIIRHYEAFYEGPVARRDQKNRLSVKVGTPTPPKPTSEPTSEPEPEAKKTRPAPKLQDPERARRVAELYAKPESSLASVAREVGISAYTVRRDLTALGIEIRKDMYGPERRKKSEEQDERIRELHAQGAEVQDIADHIGIMPNAVRRRMQRLHLSVKETPTTKLSLNSIAANALNEQAILADLLLQQDLDLVHLTEEQVKAWEATARRIGSGLAHVRRRLKKGANP